MDKKLEALLALWAQQKRTTDLFLQAEAAKVSGDYVTAYTQYTEYISQGRTYLNAAIVFNERFPDANSTLEEIVRPIVNALMVGADIAHSLGKRDEAEPLRKEAGVLSKKYLGRQGSAESERSQAALLILEGRFNEAIVSLMNARDFIVESGDNVSLARISIDVADLFQWLGDYSRARDEIDHAGAIIEPLVGEKGITQSYVLGGVLGSIASIMQGKGDSGDAMRAAQLYRAFTEVTYYRGLIAKANEQWELAEQCFIRVLPEYRSLGAGEAIEYQLAHVKLGQGSTEEALHQMLRLAPAFERGAFRAKRPAFQKFVAECLGKLGKPKSALPLVEESIEDLSGTHFDPDVLWRAQMLHASLKGQINDSVGALEAYRDALATVGELRRAPLGYRLDSTFLNDKKQLFSKAIAAAVAAEAGEDCCRFMDQIKSRTLTAVLSVPRTEHDEENVLGDRFDELARQLDALEYQSYRDGWGDRRARHEALLSERRELLERIRISDPRWRTLSQAPQLQMNALLKALADRSQAAFTLFLTESDLYVLLLIDREIYCERMPVSTKLAGKLAAYAKNLQKKFPDPLDYDLSVAFSIQATDLIPAWLLSRALSASSLVIVPHGLLHLISWAALMHEGKRLFEKLPVGILPNLATLTMRGRLTKPRSCTLFGVAEYSGLTGLGDLPSVRGELDDVAQLYRDAGAAIHGPMLDAQATEEAFWTTTRTVSGPANVLHVSCHGTMVLNEPASSGLLLFDSKVDAGEIARAPLPFDEAVLSACSTGWRPTEVENIVLTADEILGIPAGFLEAGVQAILVSITKAQAKAGRMFTSHYHRARLGGETPLSALQTAQKQMLDLKVAPSTWVGFTLYGCI